MKLAIVLDNKVNKWALQRFEPLKNNIDITVFVGEKNDYDVSYINLNKKFLTHSEEILLALKDIKTTYKRVIKAPYKKLDFYYFSLRKYLPEIDIAYSCDITRSAYTLASLKDLFNFKFLLSWWENIPYRAIFDNRTNFQKKFIMEKVDMFLPFTQMAKKVLEMEGVEKDKITVIYPGVDTERFSPGNKPPELMFKHNIDKDSFVILYVGKLVSWKGVHNLIYVAKILRNKGLKNFIIAVVGKGAQKENMIKLIKESNIEEHFRFFDFISYNEMPDIYRMADIFVLPSYPTMTWQEQFGMVLIEAMATGKPVISTMSGAIPEVIGNAGILIPPGDYFALTNAVNELMENSNLREKLGKIGRERTEKLFNASQNSQKFADLLNKIKGR
ncbi:MAG: glycosyltransferase family 4 protein [Candidatus Goldbacteria bacterium]|nr:glycosyltransferase family 4 protein [Candidatus Goldiibacteriota bacterium]